MCRQPETRSFQRPAPARKAAGWLAALIGVALMAFTVQGHADSRETLGAGDTIRIAVFQNPDLATEMRLSERGTIVFPLIGEVTLGGLTPAGAGARIAEQLKQGNFIKNPQVNVSVVQVRSRQVSVLGHVARPGRYALDDINPKLTDLLALAGGITPAGDDTVTVMVTRGGKITKLEIDVPRMYRSGDLSRNIEVESGDTIFVQRAPVFYIYGEVQRAGAYRLEPEMAVMHALSLGGGLTPRGTERGLKIHRRMPDGTVVRLDARLTDPVQPDDVIHVSESLF
ncbi:MAG: polysaccharide export protein EpsE [Betaproteobacteria bacterium]|nr:polysaccharide export protein EpsE [Betaproteobacteria bacterium]